MSYLLDTNAISDAGKPRPNAGLAAWFSTQEQDDLWLSALTIGELKFGALILPEGQRRQVLEGWITQTLLTFSQRTINIDSRVATTWAEVGARHRAARRTISPTDELIAATAIVHDLTIVTRNVRDFEHSGAKVLSPWS